MTPSHETLLYFVAQTMEPKMADGFVMYLEHSFSLSFTQWKLLLLFLLFFWEQSILPIMISRPGMHIKWWIVIKYISFQEQTSPIVVVSTIIEAWKMLHSIPIFFFSTFWKFYILYIYFFVVVNIRKGAASNNISNNNNIPEVKTAMKNLRKIYIWKKYEPTAADKRSKMKNRSLGSCVSVLFWARWNYF